MDCWHLFQLVTLAFLFGSMFVIAATFTCYCASELIAWVGRRPDPGDCLLRSADAP